MTQTLSAQDLISRVKFDTAGLVPAVAQDARTGAVLMMAWMNEEALRLTIETRQATYWSRSRGALWRKGETSGHIQGLEELWIDCDGDTVLIKVNQTGPACHTGAATCFFRKVAL
jgi:phosphoribosyl-AMP cyclohydrolase